LANNSNTWGIFFLPSHTDYRRLPFQEANLAMEDLPFVVDDVSLAKSETTHSQV
jgi:hypothetical protein